MHVLITGGAGFIGSHLTERLLRDGHSVSAVDDLSTGSLANVRPFLGRPDYRFVRDNIRSCEFLPAMVSDCDAVVHLAAAVGVRLIVEQPVRSIETNIHGTEVILALAGKLGRKILIASTSEVYGKSEKFPFNEDDDTVMGLTRYSRWSYACSKAIDEFLGFAYHQEFGTPVIVVRLFNTIGPRQRGRYGMVAPRFVKAAMAGEPLTVYGDGNQSRCFCDVADVADGLYRLLQAPAAVGECFNVGNSREISIADFARLVIRTLGSKSQLKFVPYEEIYGKSFEDMTRRVPDTTKIKRVVGFEPKITLEETIQRIATELRQRSEIDT